MKLNRQHFAVIFVLATIIGFLLYRLTTLTFRHGDGNLYLYAGHALTQGILPYRDYIFADPPAPPIILAFFEFSTRHSVASYLLLPIFLEAINAVILYKLLVHREVWHYRIKSSKKLRLEKHLRKQSMNFLGRKTLEKESVCSAFSQTVSSPARRVSHTVWRLPWHVFYTKTYINRFHHHSRTT